MELPEHYVQQEFFHAAQPEGLVTKTWSPIQGHHYNNITWRSPHVSKILATDNQLLIPEHSGYTMLRHVSSIFCFSWINYWICEVGDIFPFQIWDVTAPSHELTSSLLRARVSNLSIRLWLFCLMLRQLLLTVQYSLTSYLSLTNKDRIHSNSREMMKLNEFIGN